MFSVIISTCNPPNLVSTCAHRMREIQLLQPFFHHELWLNQFSQNRLIFKYLTMKFIRVGVIQFDLFPRNCELTSAFENSASLIGKSTLCYTVLTRSKNRVFSFHREDIAPFFFFFLFDRTVCSCAKQSGVIGKIVDSFISVRVVMLFHFYHTVSSFFVEFLSIQLSHQVVFPQGA